MKKGIVVAIVVFLALGAWWYLRSQEASQNQLEPARISPPPAGATNELPDMPLTRPDNTQFSAKELQGKTVLIIFDPDCDHCQRQAKEMQQFLPAFSTYTVYFVSFAATDKMQRFFMEYNLAGPNINFAYSPAETIFRLLGPIQFPATYIYSEQGRLVKSFIGETPMSQIVPVLKAGS